MPKLQDLVCLDRPHRLAFILGEIVELDHHEGALALGIKAAAFRKRVSRAREQLVEFTRQHCGIVNPDNPCRCRKPCQDGVCTASLRLAVRNPG